MLLQMELTSKVEEIIDIVERLNNSDYSTGDCEGIAGTSSAVSGLEEDKYEKVPSRYNSSTTDSVNINQFLTRLDKRLKVTPSKKKQIRRRIRCREADVERDESSDALDANDEYPEAGMAIGLKEQSDKKYS